MTQADHSAIILVSLAPQRHRNPELRESREFSIDREESATGVVLKQACWLCNSFQHISPLVAGLIDILWALLLLKITLKMPRQAQDGNMNVRFSP